MRIQTGIRNQTGFTLVEVLIASVVGVLALAGLISGYIMAVARAEWSGSSLAAQSLATQRIEQTRSAAWDPRGSIPTDELVASNFPPKFDNVLDIPICSKNIRYATNYTTITDCGSANAPFRMIRVDCVWSLGSRGPFTNTMITYRSPDQ